MPIVFRCKCLQKLSVSRKKAGTQVRCPKCQQLIQTPTFESQAKSETVWVDPDDQQPSLWVNEIEDSPPPQSPTDRPAQSRLVKIPQSQTTGPGIKPLLIVAICLFAIMSVIGIITLVVFSQRGEDKKVADNDRFQQNFEQRDSEDFSKPTSRVRKSDPARAIAPSQVPRAEAPPPAGTPPTLPDFQAQPESSPPRSSNPREVEKKIDQMFDPSSFLKRHFDEHKKGTDAPGSFEEKILNPDAQIKGVGKKTGINYFPREFNSIKFVNLVKAPKPPDAHLRGNDFIQFLDRIQAMSGVNRKDVQCLVRGEFTPIPWHSDRPQLEMQPILIVVKMLKKVDAMRAENNPKLFKKFTTAGKTYYQAAEGYYFGFPDDHTMILGSRNEVLYGLRFGSRNTSNPKFEWIDHQAYECVQIWFHSRNSGIGSCSAYGLKDGAYHQIDLLESTQRAFDLANLQQKQIDRVLAGQPYSNDPQAIANAIKRQQAAREELKKIEIKVFHDGPRLIMSRRPKEQTLTLWSSHNYRGFNPVDQRKN